jgi:DNA mismatch repair ATPase MutS
MIELSNILNKCNNNSLVLIDELCKGTEQASSHSLTLSVINHFISEVKCKFIITTHMHSIFQDKLLKETIKKNKIAIKHMLVEIKNGKMIYKRKLVDGTSTDIYGLEIAKTLGINQNVIKNAMKYRNNFLNHSNEFVSIKKSKYNSKKYMIECEMCGVKKQNQLETHHIIEQRESNKNGYLENEMYHKNELFNLMVLCKKCHKKITFKKVKTSKKNLTSDGIVVDK